MTAPSKRNLIQSYIDFLELLECPVCYEYGHSPLKICQRGHFVCGGCAQSIAFCPSCNSQFSNIQPLILEKIMETVIYPCDKIGCGVMVSLINFPSHEQKCLYSDEQNSKYPKNEVLSHNILQHIEDNYAYFFLKLQDEIFKGQPKHLKKGQNSENSAQNSIFQSSAYGKARNPAQNLSKKNFYSQSLTLKPTSLFKKIDKGIQCELLCEIHQCTLQINDQELGVDTVDSNSI